MSKKAVLIVCFLLLGVQSAIPQAYQYAKQGFSMKMPLDNRGAFGRVCYPGVIGGTDPGPQFIGLEYPIGQPYEHLFGAGLWVGGILDTSTSGNPVFVKGVTVGYEGWSGPYFEFFREAHRLIASSESSNHIPPSRRRGMSLRDWRGPSRTIRSRIWTFT